MSIKNYPVLIGARGWLHPRWDEAYYPPGLPEEWRLTYYANEFPVVVVPATDWEELSSLAGWVDDTDGECGFVLELSATSSLDEAHLTAMLDKAKALGSQCIGFILPIPATFQQQAAQLRSRLQKIQTVAALCVDDSLGRLTPEWQTVLAEQGVGQVWHGEDETEGLQQGTLAVVMIDEARLAPRRLRQVLETCLAASTDNRSVVLCFTAASVDIELLHNADTMLGLM